MFVSEALVICVWWWRICVPVCVCASSGWLHLAPGREIHGARSAVAGLAVRFHWSRRFPCVVSHRVGGIAVLPVSFTAAASHRELCGLVMNHESVRGPLAAHKKKHVNHDSVQGPFCGLIAPMKSRGRLDHARAENKHGRPRPTASSAKWGIC